MVHYIGKVKCNSGWSIGTEGNIVAINFHTEMTDLMTECPSTEKLMVVRAFRKVV